MARREAERRRQPGDRRVRGVARIEAETDHVARACVGGGRREREAADVARDDFDLEARRCGPRRRRDRRAARPHAGEPAARDARVR